MQWPRTNPPPTNQPTIFSCLGTLSVFGRPELRDRRTRNLGHFFFWWHGTKRGGVGEGQKRRASGTFYPHGRGQGRWISRQRGRDMEGLAGKARGAISMKRTGKPLATRRGSARLGARASRPRKVAGNTWENACPAVNKHFPATSRAGRPRPQFGSVSPSPFASTQASLRF